MAWWLLKYILRWHYRETEPLLVRNLQITCVWQAMFSLGNGHPWVVILKPAIYYGIHGSQFRLVVWSCPYLLPWMCKSPTRIPSSIKYPSNVFIVMMESNLVLCPPESLRHLAIGVVSFTSSPFKCHISCLRLLLLRWDVHAHVVSHAFLCVESPWVPARLLRFV